jgi:signal transduction histidine kinase
MVDRWSEFSVIDSGGGLAPEMSGRLYEAFYSTKSYGMGIGLSLCRSIVESHQGQDARREPLQWRRSDGLPIRILAARW